MKEPPLETEDDIRANMALAMRMGWRVHEREDGLHLFTPDGREISHLNRAERGC